MALSHRKTKRNERSISQFATLRSNLLFRYGFILVTSQIVLAIELFISGYNLYQEDCRKYSRNLWSNIRFIFFITLFVVAIVSFDWTYKFFSEFEFPFVVISLIVLLFPLILFIGHIVISRIIVTFVTIKCRYYLYKVEKCLQVQDVPQD